MQTLMIFLIGAFIGAACMWSSCRRANLAADAERRRMEKQETMYIEAMNAYKAESESWRLQVSEMRIDQANNAGYIEGYNACRKEMESCQNAGYANEIIAQGLRDGKRVTWAVINH